MSEYVMQFEDPVSMKAQMINDWLRAGHKVETERTLNYVERVPTPIGGYGFKTTEITCFWVNPQYNRMFAKLEDGREIDYNLSFLDIVWNTFRIYDDRPLPKEMTLAEIEEALGHRVVIKEE